MIINANVKKSEKLKVEDGTKRTRTKFVLWPHLCEKSHWHWLERVDVREKYSSFTKKWWNNDERWYIHQKFFVLHCICNKEIKKNKGLEIGKVYVCKNTNRNPFQNSLYYVKIVNMSGKYVQYIFVDEMGNSNCSSPIRWSNDIKSFHICYREKTFSY